jgi:hypothetical protein
MGEAAGLVAAVAAKSGRVPREVSYGEIKDRLISVG